MINLPLNIDYTGKVVVVTGAGGVLCGDMARAYAIAGAKVAALDLNEEAVKKLADELKAEGFICEGYKANVLDREVLEEVHKQVLNDLGPCDILINGAGGNNPRATTDNEYQHEAKEGQKTFFDLDAAGVDFQNIVLKELFGWEISTSGDAFAPVGYKDLYCKVELRFNSTDDILVLPKVKLNSRAVIASMKTDVSRANITGSCYPAYVTAGSTTKLTDMAVITAGNADTYEVKASGTETASF